MAASSPGHNGEHRDPLAQIAVIVGPGDGSHISVYVSGVLRVEIRGDQVFIYNPTSYSGRDEMLPTERIFRALAQPTPPAGRQRTRRWLPRWARSRRRGEGGGATALPPDNTLAGRVLDVLEEFLAARAGAEKRGKAWAAALTILTLAIAAVFFVTGNVVAGGAFLAFPVCALIGRFLGRG